MALLLMTLLQSKILRRHEGGLSSRVNITSACGGSAKSFLSKYALALALQRTVKGWESFPFLTQLFDGLGFNDS